MVAPRFALLEHLPRLQHLKRATRRRVNCANAKLARLRNVERPGFVPVSTASCRLVFVLRASLSVPERVLTKWIGCKGQLSSALVSGLDSSCSQIAFLRFYASAAFANKTPTVAGVVRIVSRPARARLSKFSKRPKSSSERPSKDPTLAHERTSAPLRHFTWAVPKVPRTFPRREIARIRRFVKTALEIVEKSRSADGVFRAFICVV